MLMTSDPVVVREFVVDVRKESEQPFYKLLLFGAGGSSSSVHDPV